MTTVHTFRQRYPALTFYALVFAISWAGVLAAVGGFGAIPGTSEQVKRLWSLAMLMWFIGPSMAGLVDGWVGFRDLLTMMRGGQSPSLTIIALAKRVSQVWL